jgi:hypothetical protein
MESMGTATAPQIPTPCIEYLSAEDSRHRAIDWHA